MISLFHIQHKLEHVNIVLQQCVVIRLSRLPKRFHSVTKSSTIYLAQGQSPRNMTGTRYSHHKFAELQVSMLVGVLTVQCFYSRISPHSILFTGFQRIAVWKYKYCYVYTFDAIGKDDELTPVSSHINTSIIAKKQNQVKNAKGYSPLHSCL